MIAGIEVFVSQMPLLDNHIRTFAFKWNNRKIFDLQTKQC